MTNRDQCPEDWAANVGRDGGWASCGMNVDGRRKKPFLKKHVGEQRSPQSVCGPPSGWGWQAERRM